MLTRLRFALLAPLALLSACSLPSSTSDPISEPLNGPWQNWQIQQGAAITSPPTGLYFLGAVQWEGTQSAAVFATPGTGQPTPTTGNIILSFLGTYNSSTGAVALFPAATPYLYAISFNEPSSNSVVPVSIIGGCVYPLSYQGPECLALANLSPAVGVEIVSLTGTYVGTLTNSSPSLSGTASLTLTQTATPNSAGQFPLSGTIAFPSDSGFGTAQLGGTVAGEGITLSDSSAAPNSPTVNVTATASPDGSQITVTNLLYSNYGPGAVFTYTGTLTRQ